MRMMWFDVIWYNVMRDKMHLLDDFNKYSMSAICRSSFEVELELEIDTVCVCSSASTEINFLVNLVYLQSWFGDKMKEVWWGMVQKIFW